MGYLTPIGLLQKELKVYKLALLKSITGFKAKQISKPLHDLHKSKLTPKILEFEEAIQTLKTYKK